MGNIVLPKRGTYYPGWGTLFSLQGKHITQDREHCSPCKGTYYPGWGTLFSLHGNISARIGNIVFPAGKHITQDREHCSPCRGTYYSGLGTLFSLQGTYLPGCGTLFSLQGNILPRMRNIVLSAGEHINEDGEHFLPCRGTHYPG